MKDNVLLDKSFAFAIRTVKAYKFGANAQEAVGGQSRPDFISKLSIAYKEAREAKYWIRLLQATNYLEYAQAKSLLDDVEELLKIIGKIQITTKNNS